MDVAQTLFVIRSTCKCLQIKERWKFKKIRDTIFETFQHCSQYI